MTKPVKTKTGRLSNEDRDYILRNAGKVPALDMARALGRRVDAVEKVLRSASRLARTSDAKQGAPVAETAAKEARNIKADLKDSAAWQGLQKEFTPSELVFFEEQFTKLMTQFKGDIFPAEEFQVFDVIKLEVLKSRNLQAQKTFHEKLQAAEEERSLFLDGRSASDLEGEDRKRANALASTINSLREGRKEYITEYTGLHQRGESLMKSLKSTRDQRIKEIESNKDTMLGLIKSLQNQDKQDAEMREMELMRLAAEKEMRRLGSPHTYEDGEVDHPILSAETIDFGSEMEGESAE